MKHTPLILAAITPFVAVAAPAGMSDAVTVDSEKLRAAMPVSELTGIDVLAPDGRDVGDVENVLVDASGRLSLVIERQESGAAVNVQDDGRNVEGREPVPYWADDQETFADDEGDFGEVGGTDIAGSVESETAPFAVDEENAEKSVKIDWSKVSYDRDQNVIVLRGSARETEAVAYGTENRGEKDSGMQQGPSMQGEVPAASLLGKDVNLVDEEDYGEVEEILIDAQRGEATALVVNTGGFFSSETYAIPFSSDTLQLQQEAVALQLNSQDFETAEPFDMESLEE